MFIYHLFACDQKGNEGPMQTPQVLPFFKRMKPF